MLPVMVTATHRSGALVELPYELTVERGRAPERTGVLAGLREALR
jgi:hypothetical protein